MGTSGLRVVGVSRDEVPDLYAGVFRFIHDGACISARDADCHFTTMSESFTPDPELRKITTSVAEHCVWGNQCDGWHLLRTSGLSVISRNRNLRNRNFNWARSSIRRTDDAIADPARAAGRAAA